MKWCCRTQQPPWPEGVPLALAAEVGQHRRAPDGRVLHVAGIDGEHAPNPSSGRCDVYVTDTEGRRVYAVMTAWRIATTFCEVLDEAAVQALEDAAFREGTEVMERLRLLGTAEMVDRWHRAYQHLKLTGLSAEEAFTELSKGLPIRRGAVHQA